MRVRTWGGRGAPPPPERRGARRPRYTRRAYKRAACARFYSYGAACEGCCGAAAGWYGIIPAEADGWYACGGVGRAAAYSPLGTEHEWYPPPPIGGCENSAEHACALPSGW
mmetsp:Transcript_49849/g.123938  ORF Transcript_49849/g.123938 Transcript_49849/m.123938 type:complete len:111 (-) Transcript_49849:63-395(-)